MKLTLSTGIDVTRMFLPQYVYNTNIYLPFHLSFSAEMSQEVYEFRPRVMIVVLSSKGETIEDDFDAQCLHFFFTGNILPSFKPWEKKIKVHVKRHSYLFAVEDFVFKYVKKKCFVNILNSIEERKEYGFGWYDYFFFFFMNDLDSDMQNIDGVLQKMHSIKGLKGKPKFCFFETRTDEEIEVKDHFLVFLPKKGEKLSAEQKPQREPNQPTQEGEDSTPSPLVKAFVNNMGYKQDMEKLADVMEMELRRGENDKVAEVRHKLIEQVVI